jgi:tRNA(Arg) A34 adenosine deaminase TadA
MHHAIAQSVRAGLEYATSGAFGALIAKDGQILAQSMNRVIAILDPTWHAEMEAIRIASITLQSFKLTGCTIYTSAEPFSICLAAVYWAGIERI